MGKEIVGEGERKEKGRRKKERNLAKFAKRRQEGKRKEKDEGRRMKAEG